MSVEDENWSKRNPPSVEEAKTAQSTPSPATDVNEVAESLAKSILKTHSAALGYWYGYSDTPKIETNLTFAIKQSLLTYGEKLRGEVEELSQVIDKTSEFIGEKFGIKGEHGYMFTLERIAKERQDLQSANESLRKEIDQLKK